MLLERQPSTGLCGQKIGGQLGCMLPGEHEGPHDIGGALRRRSPVLKPVETAPPRPAAPPAPKSKAVPARPGPRPGSWAVAAGELAWAKIKGYPWWPARVKQHGQSARLGSVPARLLCHRRAWRLWAARHSQEEAGPLSAQPLPRVLELAASKVADVTAFDHAGTGAI